VFNDLVKQSTKEGIKFEIKSISETREADYYPGFQVKLFGYLENTRVPFKMDLTTGDSILPEVTKHKHKLMFEDKIIEIPAYPIEQIIAEKLSATLSFGVDNSRAKDFYDLYTIPKLEEIDQKSLYKSVRNTFSKRGNLEKLESYYDRSMESIANSIELKDRWDKYKKENPFAKDISYDETVDSIKQILNECIEQEKISDQRKR
jgi:predicted nucleotidyltransferase component of viral defense system